VTARHARGVLAAGAVLAIVVALAPLPGAWLWYDLTAVVFVALALIGVRRNRPEARAAWLAIIATNVCFVLGDVMWDMLDHVGRSSDAPPGADVVHLLGYPLLVAGLTGLVRHRRGGDHDGLVDAGIFAVAAAFVTWQALVRPVLVTGDDVSHAVALLYPVLDVIVLVLVARLALEPRERTVAYWFLVAATVAMSAADTVYALSSRADAANPGAAASLGWLLAYVFFAATTLHPSVVDLSKRHSMSDHRLSRARLAALVAALLATPAAQLISSASGYPVPVWTTLGVACVMTGLVIWRITGLVGAVDRAQARVRASERRFRSLVQRSSDVIAVLDREGRILWVSPSIEAMLGCRRDQITGQVPTELIHPDDVAEIFDAFTALLDRAGATARIAFRAHHADGSWRWVDASFANLLGDAAVNGIVVNGRDVTAQRESADAVHVRAVQQEAVARIGQLALEGADPSMLASDAVDLIRHTLEVAACELFRVVDGKDELALEAASGPSQDLAGQLLLPMDGTSQASCTLAAGVPVIATDVISEPRFMPPVHLPGAVSAMSVSVAGRHRPYGVIVVYTDAKRAFGSNEAVFLQTAANALALALERRSAEAATRHQALHDSLTGLPNRVLFLDRLELALGRSHRQAGRVAVLFLDLDQFKVVNDSLGHDAGDQLLVAVAERLKLLLRPGDTVARFGGDEFTFLCDDVDSADDAVAIARRVTAGMADPFVLGRHRLHVTASVGIAIGQGGKATAESMLRDADAAMYRAKETGRDRYEVFDDSLRDRVLVRLHMETALRQALGGDELRMHYQPVVELSSGRTIGVEALLRWQITEDDLVGPEHFIGIAEQAGLIDELGDWVLREVCRQLAAWTEVPALAPMRVTVNLSARQLSAPHLVPSIQRALDDFRLEAGRLGFDVAESSIMRDIELSMVVLQRLKDLGLALSIDDFGTGYSSLAYLKRLPVDTLKIDRAFIEGIGDDLGDAAVVASVVRLAHALKLRTVAEGIETPAQLSALRALGCDHGQGYLFGRPAAADAVVAGIAAAGLAPDQAERTLRAVP
jgi:diguanylate cyclase (GGDEF)-like protein/PAS domain S-box-containing protein